MIIGSFEVHNTTNVTMINHLKNLLHFFDLLDKIITRVKYEDYIFNYLYLCIDFCAFWFYP